MKSRRHEKLPGKRRGAPTGRGGAEPNTFFYFGSPSLAAPSLSGKQQLGQVFILMGGLCADSAPRWGGVQGGRPLLDVAHTCAHAHRAGIRLRVCVCNQGLRLHSVCQGSSSWLRKQRDPVCEPAPIVVLIKHKHSPPLCSSHSHTHSCTMTLCGGSSPLSQPHPGRLPLAHRLAVSLIDLLALAPPRPRASSPSSLASPPVSPVSVSSEPEQTSARGSRSGRWKQSAAPPGSAP